MNIIDEIKRIEEYNEIVNKSLIEKSKVPYIYLVNEIYKRFGLVPIKIVSKLNESEDIYTSDFTFMTEFSLNCIPDWEMYFDNAFFDKEKKFLGKMYVGRELHTYNCKEKVWDTIKKDYIWAPIPSERLRNTMLEYSTLILKNAQISKVLSPLKPFKFFIEESPEIEDIALYPGKIDTPYNHLGMNSNFALLIKENYDGNKLFIYEKDIMNFILEILDKYQALKDKKIEYTLKRTR